MNIAKYIKKKFLNEDIVDDYQYAKKDKVNADTVMTGEPLGDRFHLLARNFTPSGRVPVVYDPNDKMYVDKALADKNAATIQGYKDQNIIAKSKEIVDNFNKIPPDFHQTKEQQDANLNKVTDNVLHPDLKENNYPWIYSNPNKK